MDNRLSTIQRLKSIQGHVAGVMRMVEEGAQAPEIVRQILAIEGALERVNLIILERHLHECLQHALAPNSDPLLREQALREILDVFQTTTNL